jgi:hypothetical protein
MERRDFLSASISSVLAAVGLGTAVTNDGESVEYNGGETAAPETCDQCVKLAAFQKQIEKEDIINSQYHRDRLEVWVDPKNHTWEGDCLYTEAVEVINETVHENHDFEYSKEDVQEMDYDINVSSPTPHLIDVNVVIHPPMPLRFIESTVTVGGVE